MPDKPQTPSIFLESVSTAYQHRDKLIQPKECLSLWPRRLKWYDIGAITQPVPAEVHALARVFLERRASEGCLDRLGDFGFVILHRCSEHFYFMIACSWRGNNEIWETVFAKDQEGPDFRDFPGPSPICRPFACGNWALSATNSRLGGGSCFPSGTRRLSKPGWWISMKARFSWVVGP